MFYSQIEDGRPGTSYLARDTRCTSGTSAPELALYHLAGEPDLDDRAGLLVLQPDDLSGLGTHAVDTRLGPAITRVDDQPVARQTGCLTSVQNHAHSVRATLADRRLGA